MRIGIIGAGMIGGTLGGLWARAGHQVLLSSRHPDEIGVALPSATPEEAARFGDVVLLAVPFAATAELSAATKAALAGKVVLDAGNPFPLRDGDAAVAVSRSGRGSGRWTAERLPGARVVKAFNTVYSETLASQAGRAGERIGIPLAADEADAMELAEALVRDAGFDAVPVGPLDEARRFDPGTPPWNTGATAAELWRLIGAEPPEPPARHHHAP
jgi:8-hydroxy-5-deazaflavin:NADPH oxidoreductase